MNKKNETKGVLLPLPKKLHKKIKIKATKQDKTIIQIIIESLEKEFK